MEETGFGISVVVPVFRSTSTLIDLIDRIDNAMAGIGPYEVILVDDGSPAETWDTIKELSLRSPRVRGIRLGRNYGQHSALVAGVRAASMPITVTVDDDLQNPPEEIPRLVAHLIDHDLDVVYGVPEHIEQTMSRRLASKMIRTALSSGLGVESAPDTSSFRGFRTQIRDAFSGELGTGVSLDALLTWGSSRYGSLVVRHDPRNEGVSNYSLARLLRFAIDTTTGYSTLPLQAASVLGLCTAAFGFVAMVWVVVRPLMSGTSVPGFPFLASTVALFAGVQLLTLGIMGEYLARMHFRIMRKPTYMVSGETRVGDAGAEEPVDPEGGSGDPVQPPVVRG